MAEGWCRHLHGELIEPFSAGIEKHGLDPAAVKIMRDAGVDISGHVSKLIDELPLVDFDLVITVCGNADAHCPVFPRSVQVIHKSFDDPPRLAADITDEQEITACYRKVCDEIHDFVKELPAMIVE